MTVENRSYRCPHCTTRLEVVHVKFRLASVAVVSGCPSCMIIIPDERHGPSGIGGARKPPNLAELARSVFRMMEALNSRVRYALAFLIAALITAALLRHVVHVYGGISREGIRTGALFAITAVSLALFLFARRRWH